jgi:hypothetical protein
MRTIGPSAKWAALLALFVGLVVGPLGVAAQSPLTIRLALLSQWSVHQHRGGGWLAAGPIVPELRAALEGGVVDRPVFWWQRGVIQRSSVVWKPIRVLAGPEAAELGGRGEFDLVAARPATGAAAWSQIDVRPRSGQADDVLVLEVGGELNTITQLLETLLLVPADGPIQELSLGRPAVSPASGVPVVTVPAGRLPSPAPFRGESGIEFLVARSPVESLANADTTPSGAADRATSNVGDWREGDRVFIRVPVARLQAGTPGLVLGWKDRTLKPDPDGGGGGDERRRSSLHRPRPG